MGDLNTATQTGVKMEGWKAELT